MISSKTNETIKNKYQTIKGELDERGRRMWVAIEADTLGHGGIVAVANWFG